MKFGVVIVAFSYISLARGKRFWGQNLLKEIKGGNFNIVQTDVIHVGFKIQLYGTS